MKPKQILILGTILGVLALGILLKSWVRAIREGEGLSRHKSTALAVPDPAKIERILIGRGSEAALVELANENGIWRIKSLWDAQADPAKMGLLVRKLGSLSGELRGTGKDLFGDFGIGDTDSFSIKCLGTEGVTLLDLRLGTKQAGGEGCFIRETVAENVYWVDLDPAELLGTYADLGTAKPSSDAWADLRLFSLDPEKVTGIEVDLFQGDKKTRVAGLARETDPKDPLKIFWKFLRPEMTLSLDPDKVVKFLATLNSVRAEKVVDPEGKDYGLEKPVWKLAVTEEGKEKSLISGPKNADEKRYYVKTSPGVSIFSLTGSFFDDLNVDDTSFVKETPATNPSEVQSEEGAALLSEAPEQAA